jgi:hypothetical protein
LWPDSKSLSEAGRATGSLNVERKLTYSWGIIVVLSIDNFGLGHWISSYNMEGELLNEFQLRQRPTTLNVFTSGSGFDYIAYADEKNAVYVVDAIRGKPEDSVCVISGKVIFMVYDIRRRVLVAVTLYGTVIIINAPWE